MCVCVCLHVHACNFSWTTPSHIILLIHGSSRDVNSRDYRIILPSRIFCSDGNMLLCSAEQLRAKCGYQSFEIRLVQQSDSIFSFTLINVDLSINHT